MKRVLFIGGCQLTAYTVAPGEQFPEGALSVLQNRGIECEVTVVGFVNLSKHQKIAAACRAAPPDVVVYQFGHWETVFVNLVRQRLWMKPKSRLNDSNKSPVRWKLKLAAKYFVDCAFGRSLLRPKAVEAQLRTALQCAREVGARVLLLSPFPCKDPVVNRYRRLVARVFADVSRQFVEVSFLDVFDLFANSGEDDFYHDPVHFNAKGNAFLGEAVGKALTSLLDCTPARRSSGEVRLRDRATEISMLPNVSPSEEPLRTVSGISTTAGQ